MFQNGPSESGANKIDFGPVQPVTRLVLAPRNLDRVHSPETFEALKVKLNKFFNCLPTNITCDKNNEMLNGFKFKIALVEKVSKVYSCVGEGNYSAATRACFKLPSGGNKCQNEEYYDCVRTELMKSNKCSSLEEQFFREMAKDMMEGCRMESYFMNKYYPAS
ncbi:hypothetical protein CRE_21448 [Caenorhabditis remanei]|uniref:DUF19 domain-containing protein n=1 Tax=Caenorhabditis remanei TaxID=31234 RepID=E3N3P2_CAERE|nr:hypothetical protein CRE_21448 [Caenorhabditis remanei]